MLSSLSNNLLRSRQLVAAVRKGLSTTCICNNNNKHKQIENVTVIGGGTMGSGIAQACAQSGFQVTVVDSDEYVQKCMVSVIRSLETLSKNKFPNEHRSARKFINDVLACIKTTQSVEEGCKNADVVIEAIVEDLGIKQDVFKKIDAVAPPNTIFASNTSSLSIEELGKATSRPDRFGGLHFFNPAWKMQLVEVISAPETSDETIDKMLLFVEEIGKVPVKCKENNETSGFIVNSLIFPYLLEALRFLERGNASIADIDTAMKLGTAMPCGPFELIDIIGIDDMKAVVDRWHAKHPDNPKYFPSEILNTLNREQKLGVKTGQGFYSYSSRLKKAANQ